MNTEVEIDTTVDVEFSDSAVWDAVEDSVHDAAREAVDERAWDAVRDEVQNYVDEAARDAASDIVDNMDWSSVDDHLDSLLEQLRGRSVREESLCGLGTSARDAILAVITRAAKDGDLGAYLAAPVVHTPDEVQATDALEVQRRLADLERQMRVILAEISNLGERAASLTPNSVV